MEYNGLTLFTDAIRQIPKETQAVCRSYISSGWEDSVSAAFCRALEDISANAVKDPLQRAEDLLANVSDLLADWEE